MVKRIEDGASFGNVVRHEIRTLCQAARPLVLLCPRHEIKFLLMVREIMDSMRDMVNAMVGPPRLGRLT